MSPQNSLSSNKQQRHRQTARYDPINYSKKRTERMVAEAHDYLLPQLCVYKMMGGFGNNNNNNPNPNNSANAQQRPGNTGTASPDPIPNDDFLLGLDPPPYLMPMPATSQEQQRASSQVYSTERRYQTSEHPATASRRVSGGPENRFSTSASPDLLSFGQSQARQEPKRESPLLGFDDPLPPNFWYTSQSTDILDPLGTASSSALHQQQQHSAQQQQRSSAFAHQSTSSSFSTLSVQRQQHSSNIGTPPHQQQLQQQITITKTEQQDPRFGTPLPQQQSMRSHISIQQQRFQGVAARLPTSPLREAQQQQLDITNSPSTPTTTFHQQQQNPLQPSIILPVSSSRQGHVLASNPNMPSSPSAGGMYVTHHPTMTSAGQQQQRQMMISSPHNLMLPFAPNPAGSVGGPVEYAAGGGSSNFYATSAASTPMSRKSSSGSSAISAVTKRGSGDAGIMVPSSSHFFGSTSTSPIAGSSTETGLAPVVEEPKKRREIRLVKNREAARECRRKKKEYIKCLENRVADLEKVNKGLVKEVNDLKNLYSGKSTGTVVGASASVLVGGGSTNEAVTYQSTSSLLSAPPSAQLFGAAGTSQAGFSGQTYESTGSSGQGLKRASSSDDSSDDSSSTDDPAS